MASRTHFLRGELFKIILKDAIPEPSVKEESELSDATSSSTSATTSSSSSGKTSSTSTTSEAAPSPPEYLIHKSLLSSLSMEMYKHANNDMKEGRENVIVLSEVDGPTCEAFLEWAYYKDYNVSIPEGCFSLLTHTKVYVLADRFNIAPLKDLAFSKISALLAGVGTVRGRAEILAITDAITYAYDNLPLRRAKITSSSTTSPGSGVPIVPTERLLNYLTQYIAWSLEIFRYNDEFMKLVVGNSDFTDTLIGNCRPATIPPWIQDAISGGSGSKSSVSESITLDFSNQNHILHRKCGGCSYTGVQRLKCASCNYFDGEIELELKYNDSKMTTLGPVRLFGSKKDFRHECKWCKASNTYNSTSKSFTHPNGNGYSCVAYNGYIWCRKCMNPGYMGNMTIV